MYKYLNMPYSRMRDSTKSVVRSILKSEAETKHLKLYFECIGYGTYLCPMPYPRQQLGSAGRVGKEILLSNIRLEYFYDNTHANAVQPAYISSFLISHTDPNDIRSTFYRSYKDENISRPILGSYKLPPVYWGLDSTAEPITNNTLAAWGRKAAAAEDTNQPSNIDKSVAHSDPLYLKERSLLWRNFVKLNSKAEPNLEGPRFVQHVANISLNDKVLVSRKLEGTTATVESASIYYSLILIVNNPTKIEDSAMDTGNPVYPRCIIAATISFKDM